MLRVGLTGSIAVGKSFVTATFETLGCRVIDADATAREVVAPGSEGLRAVVKNFGAEVLNADGALNRERLGAIIFGSAAKRELLNSLLHPRIIAAQDALLSAWEKSDPHGIGIVDAALMIESGGYQRFDKLIVVHCRPEIQLERLMRRNNLQPVEAQKRIAAQMPQSEKLKFADFTVDTSDGLDDTRRQTVAVFNELKI